MRTPNGTTYRQFRALALDLRPISHLACVVQERQAREKHDAMELLIARALWSAYRAGCV